MNRNLRLAWLIPLLLGFSTAWTQDDGTPTLPAPAADPAEDAAQIPDAAAHGLATAAEATIRLMEDDDDEVTNDIELPELPAEGAEGQKGLDIASQAIDGGKDFGLGVADDARNNAQEAAEDRGRGESVPEGVPGRPDMPDLPTPPTS